ncbi:hypothetical protein F2P81_014927 [Scophthalmus maximus]|uniref:Uncharacterized protein n=1 Tax=Scophthalmus maximus TaxID=52904 RepID=A0A6A4SHD8_SCOMX|nr:hypothetical protein F2P81_014927 [Scophthalmus maximus]
MGARTLRDATQAFDSTRTEVFWGRRGRRRDGPIALLRRRAVLISPRDGVVGGGSVLEKGTLNSGYFVPLCPGAERRGPTRGGDESNENKEKTLRKNETSSLSMRQLRPRRRNNPPKSLPRDGNGPSRAGSG